MKFDQNKHDIEQFVYDLTVLGKMIGVSDEQILLHFKESFLPKLGVQLLESEYIATALIKAQVLDYGSTQNYCRLHVLHCLHT